MSRSLTCESVIEVTAAIKQCIQKMMKLYTLLPDIIKSEHHGIKMANFAAVEETQRKKTEIGQEIESVFEELKQYTTKVVLWYDTIASGSSPSQKEQGLSWHVELLKKIREGFPVQGLSSQVLDHQIKSLEELIQGFQKMMIEIQPAIEQNKITLQKMIQNYQESYRFWKELDAEFTASYNAQGLQKATDANSVLCVKA